MKGPESSIAWVMGAAGEKKRLGVVRMEGRTVYVCPVDQREAILAGLQDGPVIGVPIEDVEFA